LHEFPEYWHKRLSYAKESENAPDYRIVAGNFEIGAAWKKISKAERPYLSATLDDPSFPATIYARLVEGEDGGIKQGDLAVALGLSQSAYSRLESGDSVLNLSQLRNVTAQLGLQPALVLKWADQYEAQLRQQGVEIVSEKQDNSAAIVIGLGLLAALLMSGK